MMDGPLRPHEVVPIAGHRVWIGGVGVTSPNVVKMVQHTMVQCVCVCVRVCACVCVRVRVRVRVCVCSAYDGPFYSIRSARHGSNPGSV